ncbi:hypothetical protein AMTR_s00033p00016610 [Amborella trichopoda]|uniref:Uncharacterized protein n=1 Tax=Amborella trichopoda TaxID=13333 RepID=U5CW49_AMBTC|nr:hypothetical protein AMTR_s00033p00016610 [Amborella trichopoda]
MKELHLERNEIDPIVVKDMDEASDQSQSQRNRERGRLTRVRNKQEEDADLKETREEEEYETWKEGGEENMKPRRAEEKTDDDVLKSSSE